MRAGRGNPALQPWRECASHRSLCSGTDQIRPDQNRQTVHLHLLLLCGGVWAFVQHRYEDRQDHQYRRRPRASINEGSLCARARASTRPRPPATAAWTRCCTALPTATSGRKRIGISPSIASRGTSRKSVTPAKKECERADRQPCRKSVAHLGSSNVDSEVLVHGRLRPLLRPGVHRSPGPGLRHGPTVPALAESFGRGAMTNHWIDLQHSDCILIQGSNAAENHPISFKWVLKAKDKGAEVIHVDPRFTRTSARSSMYAPASLNEYRVPRRHDQASIAISILRAY